MGDETTPSLDGQEIFNEAISDKPIETETREAPAQTEEAKSESRERDDKGRFVAKKDDGGDESPPAAEATVEAPKVEEKPQKEEKPDHRIPLVELLNEREKRQRAEQERAQYEQQLWQLQQQVQQLQQPKEPIDIFADPQAYQTHVEQTMGEKMRSLEANFSLRLAHYKHGDMFMEAFNEVMSRPLNDPMRQQVINSSDPGETLVGLFQKDKLMKEVGPDPMAYVNKKLEEALENPEFLARALEKAKGVARTQPTQKIELPPSLNKVASAGKADGDSDMSGGSLYHYATR